MAEGGKVRAHHERDAAAPEPTDGAGSSGQQPIDDLQSVLADSVRRLATATDASRVFAWTPDAGNSLRVTAAWTDEAPPEAPGEADAAALACLAPDHRAVDLAEAGADSPLMDLASRHSVSAVATVRLPGEQPIAFLLVGGPGDAPGAVRPRTLATMQDAVERLASPASAAISAQRLGQLDSEIQRWNRLATLGDLLSEVVHEVRNPLVSMKTFLELLPQRLEDPEFHTEFRELVASELRRMERLIDTIIKQARPSVSPEAGGCDAMDVIQSVAQLVVQRALDRGIAFDLSPSLNADDSAERERANAIRRVAIHEDALRQVLLNLVLNALDATEARGQIRLAVESEGNETAPGVSRVVITVDDDGRGVSPELREQIFEPFHSSRSDRNGGLGLAISRRIATDAGGSLSVEASASGGARFRLVLPAL